MTSVGQAHTGPPGRTAVRTTGRRRGAADRPSPARRRSPATRRSRRGRRRGSSIDGWPAATGSGSTTPSTRCRRLPPTYLRQLKAAELGSRRRCRRRSGRRRAPRPHGLSPGAARDRRCRVDVRGASRSWPSCTGTPARKLTTVKGIRVTTVAQTLFDVAAGRSDVGPRTGARRRAPLRCRHARRARRAAGVLRRTPSAGHAEDGRAARRAGGRRVGAAGVGARGGRRQAASHALAGRVRFERQVRAPWRDGAAGAGRLRRTGTTASSSRLDGRRWHTRVADFDRDLWRTNEAVVQRLPRAAVHLGAPHVGTRRRRSRSSRRTAGAWVRRG